MPSRLHLLAATLALGSALLQAGDAVAPEAQPQPARQPQMMRMPPMGGRPAPGYEVETVTVRSADPASVSAWAELAAQGFHVVAAVPQADGAVLVFCERQARGETIRIPGVVEQDAPAAAHLRTRLQVLRPTPPPAAAPAVPAAPAEPR